MRAQLNVNTKEIVTSILPATRSSSTHTYKSYTLKNFKRIPRIRRLSEEQLFAMKVVGNVLPFKTNNYVVEKLIDWDDVPNDPIFILNFPQREMLQPHHFDTMAALIKRNANEEEVREAANRIRRQLNPHPAGQMEHNVPIMHGKMLLGMQHKYKQTVLFFPRKGQTCHAYCSFCFRWPQFTGIDGLRFGMKQADLLVQYVRQHPEVTDVLFTGGDPLVIRTKSLASYVEPLLNPKISHLRAIRFGTKALAYWPYRFTSDQDAGELLALFKKVVRSGKHLAIMAHFNHPRELATDEVKEAIARIRETGAEIRTQSPLLRHINDDSRVWSEMWKEQVRLGCVPYYMFAVRDTGARHYFELPLVRAWQILRGAYQEVSGLCRTVRGPSMSATPGKIQILGVSEVRGEKVITLRMLQGRNPDWVMRPFFAEYDEKATWLDELKPAFGEKKFFFEEELEQMYHENLNPSSAFDLE